MDMVRSNADMNEDGLFCKNWHYGPFIVTVSFSSTFLSL